MCFAQFTPPSKRRKAPKTARTRCPCRFSNPSECNKLHPPPFAREASRFIYFIRRGLAALSKSKKGSDFSEPFLLYIYANGNSTFALNKSPSIDNSSSPFCTLQSSFAIDKPKPLPSAVRDLSPRTKRSVSSSGVISRG